MKPAAQSHFPSGIRVPAVFASLRTFLFRMTFFYIPLFLIASGFTGFRVGLLMSFFTIVPLIFSLPFGIFNDRYSARRLLALGFALMSAFYGGILICDHFVLLCLLFFLGGIGANLSDISLAALLLKVVPEGRKGTTLGVYQLVVRLAFALGTFAGGLFLSAVGFPAVFLCSFFAFLLLSGAGGIFAPPVRTAISRIQAYREDFFQREKLLFSLGLFLFTFHWGAEMTSYTPFLKNSLGLSFAGAGWYMGTSLLGLAFGAFFTGRLADRFGSIRNLIYTGLFLSGIGQILMTVPNAPVSLLFRVIHEFGDGMVEVLIFFWVSSLFHVDRVSGHYGIIRLVMLTGMWLSTILFGPVGPRLGYAAPLWITGITTLLSLAFLHGCRRKIFNNV